MVVNSGCDSAAIDFLKRVALTTRDENWIFDSSFQFYEDPSTSLESSNPVLLDDGMH